LVVFSLSTLLTAALSSVVGAAPASGTGLTLYAYAKGGASSPANCPQTTTTSDQCTLAEALSLAKAGSTVALATPGAVGHYVGNWTVGTKGTTAAAPVTIAPAPGVSIPVLDGNRGNSTGCSTAAWAPCSGPILTIGPGTHANLEGITFQGGHNVASQGSAPAPSTGGTGGAIENVNGGTLIVSACTFNRNVATDGGAIDNADGTGDTGTLRVVGSKFVGNTSPADQGSSSYGGAIDNADHGGRGSVAVSSSTFVGNTVGYGAATLLPTKASTYGGGAIANASNKGSGTLTVVGSWFVGNTAPILPMGCTAPGVQGLSTCKPYSLYGGGGAIDNGDGGAGTLSVSGSTFSANRGHWGGAITSWGPASVSASSFTANAAGYGGAINSGAPLSVSASTFSANIAAGDGGAIATGTKNVIAASTFSANRALGDKKAPGVDAYFTNGVGGAIDNGDGGPSALALWASTFSGNTAANAGGAIMNGDNGGKGTVEAAADIFNGACHQTAGGTWQDMGYNVGSDASCLSGGTADVSHGAASLGPLAANGGPTETMMPMPADPAMGLVPLGTTIKLNGRSVALCPTMDQRGMHSAPGKACNAGAVQSAS
jgi:hypothetical protein